MTGERYNAIPGDTGQARGWQLAQARAREISVGQYAALRLARDRQDFRDWRKFAGRSRIDMPAALYIQTLLFRAFRPPPSINLGGHEVPTAALDLSEEAVAKVTHDIHTGKMSASLEEVSGNGYAIARGYRIGQELFQAIRPERFNLDDFLDSVNLWSPMSFQLDDSGEDGRFLLFDEPVIRTNNLLSIVNGYAVLNAHPAFEVPEVRVALTFEGDKFFYTYGSGSRDDSVVVPGLRAEYVVDRGRLSEVPYADGKLAAQKADEIARTLAARPYLYAQGGFEFELLDNDVIPDLAGTIDRITLECSSAGRVCRLEFTNERPIRVYQPERDLDRRVRQQSLLPGQQELREQARTMRLIAGAFKQSPGLVRWLHQLFKTRLGSNESTYPILIANGTGRLPVGTPLWK